MNVKILLTLLLFSVFLNVDAALLSYEGFNYPPGSESLVGKGGAEQGYGSNIWQLAWFSNDPQTFSTNLSNGSLDVSGGSARSGSTSEGMVTRFLENNLVTGNTTLWSSFLLRLDADSVGYGGVVYGTSSSGGNGGLFIQVWADGKLHLSTVGTGAGTVPTSLFPIVDQVYLLVVEMVFQPGIDIFRLYVNPTDPMNPGTPLAEKANVDMTNLVQIGFTSSRLMTIDELRIGENYEDVVPGLTSLNSIIFEDNFE